MTNTAVAKALLAASTQKQACKICSKKTRVKFIPCNVIQEGRALSCDSLLEKLGQFYGFVCPLQENVVCSACNQILMSIEGSVVTLEDNFLSLQTSSKKCQFGGLFRATAGSLRQTEIRCFNCCSDTNCKKFTSEIRKNYPSVIGGLKKFTEFQILNTMLETASADAIRYLFLCSACSENLFSMIKSSEMIEKTLKTKLESLVKRVWPMLLHHKITTSPTPGTSSSVPTLPLPPNVGDFHWSGRLESEITMLMRNETFKSFQLSDSFENISKNNFEYLPDTIVNDCPVLARILNSITANKNSGFILQESILATSILLFARNKEHCLLQRLIGFCLWRGGLSTSLFENLNHLGVSMGYKATIRFADKIVDEGKLKIQDWKASVEKSLSTVLTTHNVLRYQIVFDNLNMYKQVRHLSPDHSHDMLNWTTSAVVRNRILCAFSGRKKELKNARDLCDEENFESVFLLTSAESDRLFLERVREYKRIAVDYIPVFKNNNFSKFIEPRCSKYAKESTEKTDFVPLGIQEIDESRIQGVIQILDELSEVTPDMGNEKLPIVYAGDGLSCERMQSAKEIRVHSVDEKKTLKEVHIGAGDFHYRMTRLDDLWFKFYTANSDDSPASLAHINATIMNKKVYGKASKNFNHIYELCEASLMSLSVMAFMKFMKISKVSETPSDFPNVNNVEFKTYRSFTKNTIYCSCKQKWDGNEEMLGCTNQFCEIVWFHTKCIPTKNQPSRPDKRKRPWFCSQHCRDEVSDEVNLYTRALLYDTMTQKVRKEAIAWNDGDMIFLHWKEDLISFHNLGHNKYFKLALNFVLSQNGCVPDFIAFDLLWNRTANIKGQPGKNVPLDYLCEYIVRDCKEQIRSISGDPTLTAIERRTQIFAAASVLFKKLDNLTKRFHRTEMKKSKKVRYDEHVDTFLRRYLPLDLWTFKAGRKHKGFGSFFYDPYLQESELLKEKVIAGCKDWDNYRSHCDEFRTDPIQFQYTKPPVFIAHELFQKRALSWDVPYDLASENDECGKVVATYTDLPTLNDVQLEAVQHALNSEDVVVFLPTSFGKSMIYIYATIMLHHAKTDVCSTTSLIVSPLNSLISNQISLLNERGLKAFQFNDVSKLQISQSVKNKEIVFVFVTPEALSNFTTKECFMSWGVDLIVVDESHLVEEWGETFRPSFKSIRSIRAFVNCPMITLSGTCNKKMVEDLQESVGISKKAKIVAGPADRPNIFLATRLGKPEARKSFLESFSIGLMVMRETHPKTLIYVNTLKELKDTRDEIMRQVRGAAYIGFGNITKECIIVTYYADAAPEDKKCIEETFSKPDSRIRIIICTVSFGLGIDIPDVQLVVHLHDSPTMARLWQEIGRAGRNRKQAVSLSFHRKMPDQCLRSHILKSFDMEITTDTHAKQLLREDCKGACDPCLCMLCLCCDFCKKKCNCAEKCDFLQLLLPESFKTQKKYK